MLPVALPVPEPVETLLPSVTVPDDAVGPVVSLEADAPAAGAAPDEGAVDADAGVSVGAATSTETDAAGALGDAGLLIARGGLADTGGAGASVPSAGMKEGAPSAKRDPN